MGKTWLLDDSLGIANELVKAAAGDFSGKTACKNDDSTGTG